MSIQYHRPLVITACGVLGINAAGAFVEIENADAWFNTAGTTTTIDFVLDVPQILADQYVGLGVVFPDGNDVAFPAATFDLDGWGVKGAPGVAGAVVAQLLAPHNAIGFVYHGTITCKLYSSDQLVYTSTLFGAQGSNGAFAGIVSTSMFDRVVIFDVFTGDVFIDNMYFDTVPGPCAGGLLAVWMLGSRRRRR